MNRHHQMPPGAAGDPPPHRRRRGHRIAAVLAAVGSLALVAVGVDRARTGASAQSGPSAAAALPANWVRSTDGRRLTWNAPEPLPFTDAYHLIHVNDRKVIPAGVAPDRRSVTAAIPEGSEVADPKVVVGGRRVDVPEPAPPARRIAPAAAATADLPTLPPTADPGTPGPYSVTEGEYDEAPVSIPGLPAPVEVRAVVVAPRGASGPRPVAVFMHGGHSTCFIPGSTEPSPAAGAWPCPTGHQEIPSHRGYLDTQRLLASQGWITFSINANGINGQAAEAPELDPGARAALVRTHLDRWARWNGVGRSAAPASVRNAGAADLSKTLLVGHSRGGEAVNRVATLSATEPALPWRVRGQVLIAPVALSHDTAPGVPTAVLLAACDGDVHDLQGQIYTDASRDGFIDPALRSSVFIDGANHNFFNREWTPGIAVDRSTASDDGADYAGDPACDTNAPNRLTDAEQRKVGAVYTAAAAQAFVLRNAAVAPLLDGTPVRAATAGDARIVAHALGGHRHGLVVPAPTIEVTGEGGVTAAGCATTRDATADGACLNDEAIPPAAKAPHFGPHHYFQDEPTRTAIAVKWDAPGGKARIRTSGAAIVADATAVTARVVVPAEATGTSFAMRVVDRAGRSFELGTSTLNGMPAGAGAASGVFWAQEVRLPLDRRAAIAAGVDLLRIDHVEIVARSGRGQLWLLDSWGYRAGLVDGPAGPFPRFDVPASIKEPGDEPQEVTVTIPISVPLVRPATVYVNVDHEQTGTIVTIPAGARSFPITLTVNGDDIDTETIHSLRIVPLSGIATTDSRATIHVEDDEPTPTVTFNATASAAEGSALRWTFTLRKESGRVLPIHAQFVAPLGAPELQMGDLTEAQREDFGYVGPLDVPLSQSGIRIDLTMYPGELSKDFELAITEDDVAEPSEALQLVTVTPVLLGTPITTPVPGVPVGTTLTGLVTDR